MAGQLDLGRLERKLFAAHHEDGLYDIAIGLVLLLCGVGMAVSPRGAPSLGRVAVYPFLLVLPALTVWLGRRWVTLPRLGRVEFGRVRRARINRARVALAAAVAMTLGLTVATIVLKARGSGLGAWVRGYGTRLVPAVLALVSVSVVAFYLDFSRLYLHAALLATGIAGAELTGSAVAFFLTGLLATAVGLVVLARFMRTHPLPTGEDADVG